MDMTGPRREGAFPLVAAMLVLLLAALVMGGAAAMRSAEYDESYTALVTAPVPRPDWPRTPFTPADALPVLEAVADQPTIIDNLMRTDVHPPLYFQAVGLLRSAGGLSLEVQRGFSILLSLGALLAWMVATWRAGLPPVLTGLLTTLAYGFAYTGHVARGFAMAHLMIALCALFAVEAWRRRSPWSAALAGLAGGLAALSNYLAAFPATAMLAWLLVAPGIRLGRRFGLLVAAGLPFALSGLAALPFFLAQRGARPEQFEAFAWLPAARLLAQFNAANLFGGLPLYVEGSARLGITALVLGCAGLVALLVVTGWRRLGPTRWLWLFGAAAPSAGLLLLGAMANNLPIELRYVAFAAPFCAALAAGGLEAWRARLPALGLAAMALLVLVQAAGTAGMVFHPATRQAHRDALAALAPALGPQTLLLAPFGNDGVGLVGALLREAPARQPILLLRLDDAAEAPKRAAGWGRVVLLGIGERDGQAQAEAASQALKADPDWRLESAPWHDARRGFFAQVFVPAVAGESSRVADRAEGVVIRGPDDRREEAERIGPASVGEGSAVHLFGQQFGMLGQRLGGTSHRLPREDELKLLGEAVPGGGLHHDPQGHSR